MNNKRRGFTLLELIMVIVIIGVLAALAVPQYSKMVEKARAASATPRLVLPQARQPAHSA